LRPDSSLSSQFWRTPHTAPQRRTACVAHDAQPSTCCAALSGRGAAGWNLRWFRNQSIKNPPRRAAGPNFPRAASARPFEKQPAATVRTFHCMNSTPPGPSTGLSAAANNPFQAAPVAVVAAGPPPPSPSPFPPVAVYVAASTSASLTGNTLSTGVIVGALLSSAVLCCLLATVRRRSRSVASTASRSRGAEIPETAVLDKAAAFDLDVEQQAPPAGPRPRGAAQRRPDGDAASAVTYTTAGADGSGGGASVAYPQEPEPAQLPPVRKVRRPRPPKPMPPSASDVPQEPGPPTAQPSGFIPGDPCGVVPQWWTTALDGMGLAQQPQVAAQTPAGAAAPKKA